MKLKRPPLLLYELPTGWWTVDEACEVLKEDRRAYMSNLFIRLELKKGFKTGKDSLGRNCCKTKYYWPGYKQVEEVCVRQYKGS